jgi:hypothetical protein
VLASERKEQCYGYNPSLSSTASGVLSVAQWGSVTGPACSNTYASLWTLDSVRGARTERFAVPNVRARSPSLAVQADGSQLLALAYPPPSDRFGVVDFYRIGQDQADKPGLRWVTPEATDQLFFGGTPMFDSIRIAPTPEGGWIAAYALLGRLGLVTLTRDLVPIHQATGTSEIGRHFTVNQSFSQAYAVRALENGAASIVVGSTVYLVSPDRTQITTIPMNGWTTLNQSGDALGVSVSADGLQITRRLQRSGAYEAAVLWRHAVPPLGGSVTAIALSDDARYAYIAFGQPFGSDAERGAPAGLVRYALTNTVVGTPVPAHEFYNTTLKHYFVSANQAEIASVDSGGAGPGWSRTGASFKVYTENPPANASPVCRFYGTPGRGPNSHFYAFAGAECEAVKRDAGWTFEGIAFDAVHPEASGCPAQTLPVWRAYNNGFPRNDSNHRYSTDRAALAAMAGWSIEGAVFCSPN